MEDRTTDTSNSFKSYIKGDEQADQVFRSKSRKRVTIIVVSAVVLVTITIGAIAGVLVNNERSRGNSRSSEPSSSDKSIKAICNVTIYPDSCYTSMSSAFKAASNDTDHSNPDPQELFLLSLRIAEKELTKLSPLPQQILSSKIYSNETNDPLVQSALRDCEALFADAIDRISDSITSLQVDQGDKTVLLTSKINDIRTWQSAAVTDQETCLDGLNETKKHLLLTDEVRYAMTNSTQFTSNSLAILTNVITVLANLEIPIHRKLLTVDHGHDHHHRDARFPRWVHRRDKRLLVEEKPEPNLTVAKDGSGDFESIREAVDLIPRKSKTRFVIYVKEGVYVENVSVGKDCWNVMVYGDGMNNTIVSGSLNKVDGVTTFSSGTFIAVGRRFIAKDMGFINTAGPQKEQAVALRSSSDQSVFYRCSFDAYQDTLYTHSNRQFYRDSHIVGTIDFIFGNAAVVFQNCSIRPRQPMDKQFNTITAQSKSDPNQNTGMSIQRCQITPFDNLTASTYLGRPWREYATTVIMQSTIGELLDPSGWISWQPNIDLPTTIFYAEYRNVGPGSETSGRVEWQGVWPNITTEQAEKFTVEHFIHGSQWLPQASVVYDAML